MASLEQLTPNNSAIILIDYAVGFANLFRSTDITQNVNGSVALAKTALAFDVPLIVTHGKDTDVPGPIYPELLEVLGDHPVVVRKGNFNAFETPEFRVTVEATGRKKLIMAGLMTEGCVMMTALDGIRRGFEIFIVTDACAGESNETHQMAIQRLVQAGAVPVTWLALATEYQNSWDQVATVERYTNLLLQHSPIFSKTFAHYAAIQRANQLAR